jgi:crotonobetainyl-CoA:carnitine CoA-transferase CaiB-like acyl-CoA transferase
VTGVGEGPLHGTRVVDLTDERGIFGAKLLGDLGADVVRPESPDGDPLRRRGPHLGSDGASLWYVFFATSRRFLTIDPGRAADRVHLQRLVERADVLLTCPGTFAMEHVDLDAARRANARLVHVDVSSFGDDGPWRDLLAPDLVAGALGGAVCTTGAPDTTPLKMFGELNFMVSGIYAAIAALAGRRYVRTGGEGQRVSVPVHECLVSCLEHVLMFYWYGEKMRRGRVLPRQGGTHWSMAYSVVPAKRGAIMITPAPQLDAQLAWLLEEDAHGDLLDEKYTDPANAPLLIARMMQLMREWVAKQDAEDLFYRAQARHAPYGWVQPIERLADNPQLDARRWWSTLHVAGRELRAPGTPFNFSETPCAPRDSTLLTGDALLAELGWKGTR